MPKPPGQIAKTPPPKAKYSEVSILTPNTYSPIHTSPLVRALLNLPFLHILPFLSSLPSVPSISQTKFPNKFISYAYCTYSHFLQFDPSLLSGPPSLLSFPISPWLSNPHLPLVIDLQQTCCHYIMSTSPHYICLDRTDHLSHAISPFSFYLS